MVLNRNAGWQGSELVNGGSERQVASDAWFSIATQGGRGLYWFLGFYWGGVRGRWHPMHGSKSQRRVTGV